MCLGFVWHKFDTNQILKELEALRKRVNDIPALNEHHQDVDEMKAFEQCVALDLDVVERIDGPLKHQAGYNRYELYWFSVVVWYLLS